MNTCINYKNEYEDLLNEYIYLIEEKEYLLYKKQPCLEQEYLANFSELMKEEVKIHMQVKNLRNKIDMIMSNIDKDENFDIKDFKKKNPIDLNLCQGFDLDKIFKKGKLNTNEDSLNFDEEKEMRAIFKLLVRRLHPELHLTMTKTQMKLWEKTKQAYRTNNIGALKLVSNVFEHEVKHKEVYSVEELKEKIDRLSNDINQIKNTFPFNVENSIDNSSWIEECKEVIEKRIDKLKEDRLNLLNILNELE